MKSKTKKRNVLINTIWILIVSVGLQMLTNTQSIACGIISNNLTSNDTLTPNQFQLINKLILSERYFRDLSEIHEQKIRLLEKDIQLYSKSIDKYNVNEKEFRNKIELLEKDKQDLQHKNDKLTKQKKHRTDAFLIATGVAIIEGLLILLISK